MMNASSIVLLLLRAAARVYPPSAMSARPSESEPMSLSPPNSSVVAGVDAKRVCSPPPVFVFVVTARFFFSAS